MLMVQSASRRCQHETYDTDVVSVFRPQADARSVGQPEAIALGLTGRHLQALGSLDTLHPFGVHLPAGHLQQTVTRL